MEYFIIKSRIKEQHNWSGKEFSDQPAKVYTSFEEAVQALQAYWYVPEAPNTDGRAIVILPLTDLERQKKNNAGEVRF